MTEGAVLLDANVLIALVVEDHVHHDAAVSWVAGSSPGFATCPLTQGALVRFLVREGLDGASAGAVVAAVAAHPAHEFWPDDLGYDRVDLQPVVGHRQVTDAYLAALAVAHGSHVATFDRGLAAAHPEVALPLPG